MPWFNSRSPVLLFLCLLYACPGFSQKKLIPYQDGNKWGFADSNGKVRITPKYKRVRPFRNGIAVVRDTNNRSGFINRKGKYVLPPIYDSVYPMRDGVYIVKRMNFSWVDSNGVAVDPYFGEMLGFENGKATVSYMGKQGLIGADGKWLIEPNCRWLLRSGDTYCDHAGDSNYVHYDEEGKYLFTYHRDLGFKGNFAFCFDGKGFNMVDRKGKRLIPPGFSFTHRWHPGADFIVENEKTGLFGLMDAYGKWIAEPNYRNVTYCNSGAVMLTVDSLLEVYVARTGRWLRPKNPRIVSVSCNPSDSAFIVGLHSAGGIDNIRYNYMDSTGHFLFEKEYDYIVRSNGYALGTLGNITEWFDKNGTCFLRREHRPGRHYYFFDEQGYTLADTVTNDGNTGVYGLEDKHGNKMLDYEYSNVVYNKVIEKYLARKPDQSTVIFDPITRTRQRSDFVPQVFQNGHYLVYHKLPDSLITPEVQYKVSLLNKKGDVVIDAVKGFIEELGEHHFVTGKNKSVKIKDGYRRMITQQVYDQKVLDLQGRELFALPDEPVSMRDGFFYFRRSGRYMRQDGLKFYTE